MQVTLLLGALVATVAANPFHQSGRLIPPVISEDEYLPAISAAAAANKTGSAYFTQLLDHDNPSAGTFQQKFWWNYEFWDGPGSPVVFFTPGEVAAANYVGYLTNKTVTGLFAQKVKGAVVMVEHRYWGQSSPYSVLSTKNLQYLTLHQAIEDFANIAKTVKLPFDKNGSSNADNAPWVMSGGSYSGALSAWTASLKPGVFWAYHASSAPVEAIEDYWQYFAPVQEGMPKNCSKDVSLVVDYLDNFLPTANASAKTAMKKRFGLDTLAHDDDFMGVLENGPWLWQSNTFYSNYSAFYQFCDSVENVVAGAKVTPDENGVGLEKALTGYAAYVKNQVVPGYCAEYGYTDQLSTACMDTYNASNLIFTDMTVGNTIDRQWNWMLCNEPFDYWQDGAPANQSSLVSRMIDAKYWQRQCGLFFPTEGNYTYGSNASPDNNVHKLNKATKGWTLTDAARLIWTNGEFDPWRTAGVSSEFRPGGPLASTAQNPVQIIKGGFHCSDLQLKNAQVNPGVQQVVDNEVAQIVKWVAEWPKNTPKPVEKYQPHGPLRGNSRRRR